MTHTMKQVSQGQGFSLHAVTVRYPMVTALDSVSFDVAAGERVGFVGPSGAGKTTLLRVLNGTVRTTSGQIRVEDQDLATLSAAELRRLRGRIGFVHQDLNLVPNLRVVQNVLAGRLGKQSLAASLRSVLFPRRGEAVDVHRILERVGVAEKMYERADRLSGGQQQRVAIARALFQDPIALIADEPVASVDPSRARATVSLLTDISREQGLTLCMSLHNLELAREFFPRLVGLRHGKVAFDRPTAELTDQEFHDLYKLASDEVLDNGTAR